MMFPLVQDLAAEGFPVRLTCGTLGFSPQAFYRWRARPCSDRDLEDAWLTNALVDAHGDDPEFGYRFLTDELTCGCPKLIAPPFVPAFPVARGVLEACGAADRGGMRQARSAADCPRR